MARTKCKLTCTGDMFGQDVKLKYKKEQWLMGSGLEYNPIERLDPSLSTGYLFRSPAANPDSLADIWETVQQFEFPFNFWVEAEDKKNDKIELTAFARIFDRSEATMFAYAHSTFEKWSDEKEAEDAATRDKTPEDRVTVNADGTVRVTIEGTTLTD